MLLGGLDGSTLVDFHTGQNSRRDSDYCLDAMDFRNGEPAQAWKCSEKYLEHQIWATL